MNHDTGRLDDDAESLAVQLFRADYGDESPHLESLFWHKGVADRGDLKPHYRQMALKRLGRA